MCVCVFEHACACMDINDFELIWIYGFQPYGYHKLDFYVCGCAPYFLLVISNKSNYISSPIFDRHISILENKRC